MLTDLQIILLPVYAAGLMAIGFVVAKLHSRWFPSRRERAVGLYEAVEVLYEWERRSGLWWFPQMEGLLSAIRSRAKEEPIPWEEYRSVMDRKVREFKLLQKLERHGITPDNTEKLDALLGGKS